jgi:arylsulfatase
MDRSASAADRALLPLWLALGLAAAGCGQGREPRPNLLLVSVDTLRPDRLACYGGREDIGAGLCGLARRGTRFVWAFSSAPSTAPSVASLLTSRYPSQHGVSERANTTLPDEAVSVAELLRDAGYTTAAFVSNPVLSQARNLSQGFTIYDDRSTRRERNRRRFTEREAAATSDAALAWARVAREPWFLWVHYQDPHGPYDPPSAAPITDPPEAKALPVLEDHSGYGGIPRYQVLGDLRSWDAYARRYLDEVRYLDVHLARLVADLDALGSPLGVLLTADHGEAFGEDGYYFAHGHSLSLDQIRVPLLARPPEAGRESSVVSEAVSTLDVAPTLLAWAGLQAPAEFEGEVLPGPGDPTGSRSLFAEHRLRTAVIRDGIYYARDRESFDAARRDPVSGGALHPLPARTARLAASETPSLPPYEEPGGLASELEGELASRPDAESGKAPRVPLSEEVREQMRSLGYLE